MKIGYARVSKFEQNLDMQIDALKNYGCEKIVTDKLSGSVLDRPGLEEIVSYIRKGDVLVIYRLDRLGRSTKHLISTVTDLQEAGVGIVSLSENIDTTTSNGKLIFHIFCALAEFESNLISERTKKGLEAARKRGFEGGRKYKLEHKQVEVIRNLYEEKKMKIDEICQMFRITPPTMYRYLRMGYEK